MLDFMDGYKTKTGVWMYVLPLVLMYLFPGMGGQEVLDVMKEVLAPALVGLGLVGKLEKYPNMGK